MTERELAKELRDAAVRAPYGRKAQTMLLLGAWYRDELDGDSVNIARVRRLADCRGEVGNHDSRIQEGVNVALILDINEEGSRFGASLGFE